MLVFMKKMRKDPSRNEGHPRPVLLLSLAGLTLAMLSWLYLGGPGGWMRGAGEGVGPLQATTTPGSSPTASPDATSTPSGTGGPQLGLAWTKQSEGDLRFVEVDSQARAWMRLADPGGGPDRVALASARRAAQQWEGLEAVVEARFEELIQLGSLRDFFAVDADARRVWVGARHYAEGAWTTVSRDSSGVGGGLRHEQRALLDGEGRAGVPWQAVVDCPTPGGCIENGLDRFSAEGELDAELRFEPVPGAERDELPACHLLQAGPGGVPWVVARREMAPLDDLEDSRDYPPLKDEGGAPNAGFATAATLRPDGSPLVFLWVERRDRPTLVHELSALAWAGGAWLEVLPTATLSAAPFLSGDPAFDRIVAAAFDASGRLWLAGNSGGLGLWSVEGDRWLASWSAEDLGLPLDARIRDLAVGGDGSVWLATSAGAWLGALPVAGTIYLPRADVP